VVIKNISEASSSRSVELVVFKKWVEFWRRQWKVIEKKWEGRN
jgi:hypothetical protein